MLLAIKSNLVIKKQRKKNDMTEFWMMIFFLIVVIITIILISYYQTRKEIDDFYQTMYGEEDGKTKSTNEEITDETRKR
jgi:uncharacterized membrane protein affecting hemolysin expression